MILHGSEWCLNGFQMMFEWFELFLTDPIQVHNMPKATTRQSQTAPGQPTIMPKLSWTCPG